MTPRITITDGGNTHTLLKWFTCSATSLSLSNITPIIAKHFSGGVDQEQGGSRCPDSITVHPHIPNVYTHHLVLIIETKKYF